MTLILFSCIEEETINPIDQALSSDNPSIQKVVDDIDNYEVQILFTEIIRKNDSTFFKDYAFNVNEDFYFYPASTVKLPTAILALEKSNTNNLITLDTSFFVEGDTTVTTLRKDITNIFTISCNNSYNRLFEFLGKDSINNSLVQKGIQNVRISHRLSTANAYDLQTKPLIYFKNDSTLKTTESIDNKEIKPLTISNLKKGEGYYEADELVNEPLDFSKKNYISLVSLHQVLKRIAFPENYNEKQRFNISETDRQWLLNTMAILPREAGYDSKEYYDSYSKFFMYGDSKMPIPNHIKVHNKIGFAYGYISDCAYIVDKNNDIEFLLSATIHVNKNQIYNDDTYEYETIGIPFLAALGKEIHNQLLN